MAVGVDPVLAPQLELVEHGQPRLGVHPLVAAVALQHAPLDVAGTVLRGPGSWQFNRITNSPKKYHQNSCIEYLYIECLKSRADRKSQVRQCLDFCSAAS